MDQTFTQTVAYYNVLQHVLMPIATFVRATPKLFNENKVVHVGTLAA